MIKLDKWESQFIHLAKGWFDKEPYSKISLQDKVKIIWANRIGINKINNSDFNYYHIGYFLINLLEKVKVDSSLNLADFIMKLAPEPYYPLYLDESKYSDQSGFLFNLVKTILYSYLMILPVKDSDKILIELEPIDYSIFDDYLKNKKNLIAWDRGKYITLMSARDKTLRKGQAVFTAVAQDYPRTVDKVIDTKYDCFNDDSKIVLFLNRIEELVNDSE